MRIERCDPNGPDMHVTCCRCGWNASIRSMAADLNGEPFRAYYCADCLLWMSASMVNGPRESAAGLRLHDVAEEILGGSEAAAKRWTNLQEDA